MSNTAGSSRGVFVLASLAAVWLIAYFPTHRSIVGEWGGVGSYSHGWLAIAIVVWLFLSEREVLRLPERRHWTAVLSGVIGMLGAGFLWWAGVLANVLLAQQIGVYGVLVGALLLIWGWRLIRAKLLALLVLLLAFPVWGTVSSMLRDWTAVMAPKMLELGGLPVYLEGHRIVAPGAEFMVAEACSGLNFFLAAIILAIVFAKLNHLRVRTALLFAVVAMVIAILSNWLRVAGIVAVGSLTHMDHWIVRDHLWFGWLVFMVAIAGYIWIGHRWFVGPAIATGGKSGPVYRTGSPAVDAFLAATGIGLLVLFPAVSRVWSDVGVDANYGYKAPAEAGSYHRLSPYWDAVRWNPQFVGAGSEYHATYEIDGTAVALYVANYPSERQGAELVYYANTLYEEHAWNLLGTREVLLSTDNGKAGLQSLRNNSRVRSVAYTYVVAGRAYAKPAQAKLAQVIARMRGVQGASIVAVMAESGMSGADASEAAAIEALSQLLPAVLATYSRP
jgi:EpsI family protein